MDAFQLLSRGSKIDKRRFKSDVDLFSGPGSTDHQKGKLATGSGETDALPAELDFFKYAQNGGLKRKSTKETGGSENKDREGFAKRRRVHEKTDASVQRHRVTAKGANIPVPADSFEEMNERYTISSHLLANLLENSYIVPTGIQSHAVPILCEGRNLAAISPTGTGKTLAYLLPVMTALRSPQASSNSESGVRAIIVAPTRELAQQIHNESLKLAKGRKWRIALLSKATASTLADKVVRNKIDMIISTPLRLVTSLQANHLDLDNVRYLILDEADRLLDTEFLAQTEEICNACTHVDRQTAVFSATLPAGAEQLAMKMLKDPIRIVVGLKDTPLPLIKQSLTYVADEASKLPTLLTYLAQPYNPPLLIFTSTQDRASSLAEQLVLRGIPNVDCLHAGMSQKARDDAVSRMRHGESWVMISTEVMARGMDFKGIRTVINFDFPRNVQSYVHRIGRTGRAGREGTAITYFTNEDGPFLKPIANVLLQSGSTVPEWMTKLPKPSKMKRREMGRVDRGNTVTRAERLGRALTAKKRDMIRASKRRKADRGIKNGNDAWGGIENDKDET